MEWCFLYKSYPLLMFDDTDQSAYNIDIKNNNNFMDINEIQDTRTSFDRIGDRSYSTWKKKLKCLLVMFIIAVSGVVFAMQFEKYIQSFAITEAEAIKRSAYFPKNEPKWKVVQVTE